MLQLKLHPFQLQLQHPFNIARDSYTTRDVMIVELTDGVHTGFGEAITNAYYKVTMEGITAVVQKIAPLIAEYTFEHPADFWEYLSPVLSSHPFVQCAIDNAAYDFWGKKNKVAIHEWLGLSPKNCPITNYTIAIDTIPIMIAKMKAMPWPIYKIKLGTSDDIGIIKALRQETDAIFRVDANCGWTAKETLYNAEILQTLGVEFIEQPLKANDLQGMKEIIKHSALPIIADESCQNRTDVMPCAEAFSGINIKLVKCGGLTPALAMIKQARDLQLKVMMGCMTETSIGISAIAQVAPLLDYVDMDGALLLANDPAFGVKFDYGQAIFPQGYGLGCGLK